jgi:hypothetical protein
MILDIPLDTVKGMLIYYQQSILHKYATKKATYK